MQNDPGPNSANRSRFGWVWIGATALVIGAAVAGFVICNRVPPAPSPAPQGPASLQAVLEQGLDGPYDLLMFSPDGKTFAATKFERDSPDRLQEIKMWDVSSGKEIELAWPENGMSSVNALTFTPDSGYLAATGSMRATEAAKDGPHGGTAPDRDTAKLPAPAGVWVRSVLFHVASHRCSCWVNRWEPSPAVAIVPFPDHQTFAFGGEFAPIKLKRFVRTDPDPRTGSIRPDTLVDVGTLPGHGGGDATVRAFALTRDGRTVASAGSDTTIKLWSVETRQEIRTLKGHDHAVTSVTFGPDGRTLASGVRKALKGDQRLGEARIWDLATGTTTFILDHKFGIGTLAFSPDGKTLVTGSAEPPGRPADQLQGELRFWDVATGKEVVGTPWTKPVRSLAFYPDGKGLVVATSGGLELVGVPDAGPERE
jgi:WD40 repeat protein